MGTVETVPGVSGGTVALVVGVYETIITSAGHFLSGLRLAVADIPRGRGRSRAAVEFGRVNWSVLAPLLIGMFAALVIMARLIEGWVEDNPVQSRALFFGLVLASLWVPFSRAVHASRVTSAAASPDAGGAPDEAAEIRSGAQPGWRWRDTGLAVAAAALAFVVVSLPPGHVDPAPLVILAAAALAVSALVLPGLSGSFILLTFGLYEETLSAVNDRDFGYLGLFMLGAAIGLASFVKLLQWLLEQRRKLTLVLLTGVMAGCLRALWPWQEADRALQAPGDHLGAAVGFAVLGFGVVLVFLIAEHRWTASRTE
ncbi:DUF368 domain-containing protein [Phytoactinopolyspora sp. XMNu-373]|uniref:DUF368 domain-containing protein n=1 Tax=Phytoactinopolyspora mesophila TaxID=2650750 RepID=A0A7K3M7K8_9ACTN|nr:DUF368 domain-containing protein [Phytoactinopolyspora mesophila]